MKNTFYRVQNKQDATDFADFKTVDEARAFCSENLLDEETHQLEKWHPNRKHPKREVQLSFIMRDERPIGIVIRSPFDDSQVAVVAAQV